MERNNRPKVGVAVLVERDGKVLLHRRKGEHGKGTWSVAGGHVEYGETPEECAIREVWEEVGIRIRKVAFMGMTNDVFAETGRHYVTIWMHATAMEGDGYARAENEVEDVQWFPREALPEPLERVPHRLHEFDRHRNVIALGRSRQLQAVRTDLNFVAGPHRRGRNIAAADAHWRGADPLDGEPAVARRQYGRRQFNADVDQRHLIVGAAAKPNTLGANPMRPAHRGSARAARIRWR